MSSPRAATSAPRALEPFTVEHFKRYYRLLVFDDGQTRELPKWQEWLVEDLFAGVKRNLWIVPEGNGKSTFVGILALYGADYTESPWIPVGAASAKQAKVIFQQAVGLIDRTPGMRDRFHHLDGIKIIRSIRNPGPGIEVFAHDPNTGDGIIPSPWALLDELHRQPDMRLWELWAGKLRKRGAQIIGISTGGEPETPFENLRDEVRRRASTRQRKGSYLRAAASGEVLHEWMVLKDELCSDMAEVKKANPLDLITLDTLTEDYALVTDLADWKRLKCNRPTRSVLTAITDAEWDAAEVDEEIAAGAPIALGIDIAFKWDTTALVPLWKGPKYRLLGAPVIIVPPRDGSSLHPDDIKTPLLELQSEYRIDTIVMDMHRAEDISAWIEDTMGIEPIDRVQGQSTTHVQDFEAFTKGLRNGTLKHTGDPGLRSHVLNAIARRLPGGDRRFDRPSTVRANAIAQDRRVIDALTAAAMVNYVSMTETETVSVYESRDLITA